MARFACNRGTIDSVIDLPRLMGGLAYDRCCCFAKSENGIIIEQANSHVSIAGSVRVWNSCTIHVSCGFTCLGFGAFSRVCHDNICVLTFHFCVFLCNGAMFNFFRCLARVVTMHLMLNGRCPTLKTCVVQVCMSCWLFCMCVGNHQYHMNPESVGALPPNVSPRIWCAPMSSATFDSSPRLFW